MTTTKTAPTPESNLATAKEATLSILATLESFSSLLARETEALQESDFPTLDALQDEKKLLAKRYQEQVTTLNSCRDVMPRIDVSLRQKLVQARTSFTKILQENMEALELMKNSTQRLANRILEVARQSVTQEDHANYSQKGQMQAYKTSTLSLSMDQEL